MQRYTGKGTRPRVLDTRERASPKHIWGDLKLRFPTFTEKRTAQELSEVGGEDISPRTVAEWRRRLPSSKHLVLLFMAWPDFLRVTAEEISESEARHQRLTGALEALETPSNARNEWSNTTEEPSDGT